MACAAKLPRAVWLPTGRVGQLKGRSRPEADSRLLNVKISEVAKRIERSSTLRPVYR
jgi:hypothetical protein